MSDEKQESLNEVTNRWNNCDIKETSLDPDIWFNKIYNLNLKFKSIKANDENMKMNSRHTSSTSNPNNTIQ